MKKNEFDEWVNALRSGEFQQGEGTLMEFIGSGVLGYCCLGVKCELDYRAEHRHGVIKNDDEDYPQFRVATGAVKPYEEYYELAGMPDVRLLERWGMRLGQAQLLAKMNDGSILKDDYMDQHSFAQIADYLVEHESEFVE